MGQRREPSREQGSPTAHSVRRHFAAAVGIGALVLYAVVVLRTAWVSDDAYITLRVVDNFVNGFGLRWNVAERVQVFTHPLWLALLTIPYAVTRESFLTTIAVSGLVSLGAALVLLVRWRHDAIAAGLGILVLASSKAYVDFSTSGLENPLTHLILVGFAAVVLASGEWSTRRLLAAGALAGACVLNRMDTLVVVAPVLGLLLWRHRRPRTALLLTAGFLPLMVWECFSFVYYGALVPNTALAKLATGLPAGELLGQGLAYLSDSLRQDPITLVTIAFATACVLWRRVATEVALASGLVAYVLYVVKIGGDFMSGRFLAAPLLIAVVLLVQARFMGPGRTRWAIAASVVVLALAAPFPTIFAGRDYGRRFSAAIGPTGIADERRFYFGRLGLLTDRERGRPPSGSPVSIGKELRTGRIPLTVEGAVGQIGFFAGPGVHVVDVHALCDPLLARLPVVRRDSSYSSFFRRFHPRLTAGDWRIGHFRRNVPEGYLSSLATGRNLVRDRSVARLWDRVRSVTRGPLLSLARLETAMALVFSGDRQGDSRARTEERPLPWAELLAVQPDNSEAWLQEGIQRTTAGDRPGARAALERALALSPHSVRASTELASLDADDGDANTALTRLKRALEIDPDNARAWALRGNVEKELGRDTDAMVSFRMGLDPGGCP